MKPKYNIFQLLHDASLRVGKDLDKLMHRSLDTEAILEKGSSSSVMSDSTLMLMLHSLDTLTEEILEKGSSSNVMSDSTLCRQLKDVINGTVDDAQQAGMLRTSYTCVLMLEIHVHSVAENMKQKKVTI